MTVVWRKSSRSSANGQCVEVAWRKSSRSATNGNCVEVAWRKSTRSHNNGNCVEVASTAPTIAIRDSKHCEGRDYPVLTVSRADWTGFLASLR